MHVFSQVLTSCLLLGSALSILADDTGNVMAHAHEFDFAGKLHKVIKNHGSAQIAKTKTKN